MALLANPRRSLCSSLHVVLLCCFAACGWDPHASADFVSVQVGESSANPQSLRIHGRHGNGYHANTFGTLTALCERCFLLKHNFGFSKQAR